jgi:hypothetical protein
VRPDELDGVLAVMRGEDAPPPAAVPDDLEDDDRG